MSVSVVVVAAGKGSRFGADLPKQFCDLGGRPVLIHTVEAIRRALPGAHVVVVVSREMEPLWRELCERHGFVSPEVCHGGATRWQSVKNAVDMLAAAGRATAADVIGVHDGARPLVSPEVILQAVEALGEGAEGAIPCIPVTDSLRLTDPADGSSRAVDRSRLRAVQTPQMFRADLLAEAYAHPWRETFTDDASVMEAAGHTALALTPGSPSNIKITNPIDIDLALTLMNHPR